MSGVLLSCPSPRSSHRTGSRRESKPYLMSQIMGDSVYFYFIMSEPFKNPLNVLPLFICTTKIPGKIGE